MKTRNCLLTINCRCGKCKRHQRQIANTFTPEERRTLGRWLLTNAKAQADRSADAASATLDAMDAFSGAADDPKGASASHVAAAEKHEQMATEARQERNYRAAGLHDDAAAKHRTAASELLAQCDDEDDDEPTGNRQRREPSRSEIMYGDRRGITANAMPDDADSRDTLMDVPTLNDEDDEAECEELYEPGSAEYNECMEMARNAGGDNHSFDQSHGERSGSRRAGRGDDEQPDSGDDAVIDSPIRTGTAEGACPADLWPEQRRRLGLDTPANPSRDRFDLAAANNERYDFSPAACARAVAMANARHGFAAPRQESAYERMQRLEADSQDLSMAAGQDTTAQIITNRQQELEAQRRRGTGATNAPGRGFKAWGQSAAGLEARGITVNVESSFEGPGVAAELPLDPRDREVRIDADLINNLGGQGKTSLADDSRDDSMAVPGLFG